MKQVKLSTLKDGGLFYSNKRSKVVYQITKRIKTGVLVTAQISQRTYEFKKTALVFVKA